MALKKIVQDRQRLADVAYAEILSAIRSGAMDRSGRLVQTELAGQLHISRTPVREALLRLEQDGILDSSVSGGFVIRRMSIDEVKELYQARIAVEGQAVRLLTAENNPEKNQALRLRIRDKENIRSPTVDAYFEANRSIHRCFVELSNNRYLLEMFDGVWNKGSSYNLFAVIEKVNLEESLGDHMRLVDAIESNDPDFAQRVLADHIRDGLDLQLKGVQRSG
ncbi:MAG: GntR family transcriptional regulator [Nitrosospira sp.]|nr:GntR family transcriptional regulator [Nitrosospira sp.]